MRVVPSLVLHRAYTNVLKDGTNVKINLENMLKNESMMPKKFVKF